MRRLVRRLVRTETVAVLVIAWLAGALGLGLATGAGAVPTVALMALGPLLGGLLLLITAFLVHGGLLGVVVGALLAILAVGVAAVGALAWLARRLWRRHAWIEAAPLVVGLPWLSRVAWMARVLFTGRALWQLRTRLAARA